MTTSVAAFAHLASMAARERAGFEATQRVESGGMKIEAFIRHRGPRSIHVAYQTYQNPWTELQEALSGHVEFTGEELCGLTLDWDGQCTWVTDPITKLVIRKKGNHLFEPIPGLSTLGELSFLETLAQDYLLRDFGEVTAGDRIVRRIGLKPKVGYRSMLLCTLAFPTRRATIDFDINTYFPLTISLVPSPDSPAASVLGPNATLQVSYTDVQMLEAKDQSGPYSTPAGSRVFLEDTFSGAEVSENIPFLVPNELLNQHGFDPDSGRVVLSQEDHSDRAYATLQYASTDAPSSEEDDTKSDSLSPMLTITVGNYISKNMVRRRTVLSEHGTVASDENLPLKLLDRKALWERQFHGIDTQYAPVEVFFERNGVFWFLSGTGVPIESLEKLSVDLLNAQSSSETSTGK